MKRNDCSIVQDLLPLYIEEMLQPDTAEYVAAHLSGCEICTAALSDLKSETAAPTLDAKEVRKADQQTMKGLRESLTLQNCILVLTVIIAMMHFFPWAPLRAIYQGYEVYGGLIYLVILTIPSLLPPLYFFFHRPRNLMLRVLASLLCIPLLMTAAFPMFGGLRRLFSFHPFQTFNSLLPTYWIYLSFVLLFILLVIFSVLRGTTKKK